LALGLCLLIAALARADDEPKYDLHEISLWGLDPTLEQANEMAHYPSAMPGVVDTDRSRANEARKLTPVGLITLHGEAVKDLEIDLRVQSGRFVGHWPPAESKSGRLRWLDCATTAEAPGDALFATVDEKHWFNQARALDGLYVKDKSRSERFLTYDMELKYEVPVQITGGPEKYLITNSAKHPLLDLFVLAPEEGGVRVGHLETLSPSQPKAANVVAGHDDRVVLTDLLARVSEVNTWRLDVLDKAKASQRIEGDMIVFQVDATTDTDWHIQALRPKLDLKEGQEYIVKFQAKASADRAMTVTAGIDQADWHGIGLREKVALTGEFQPFEFKFRAQGVVKDKNRVGFILGGETGTVFVREMSLVEAKQEAGKPEGKPEAEKADAKPDAEKPAAKPDADKPAAKPEADKPAAKPAAEKQVDKPDTAKLAEVKEQPKAAAQAAPPAVVVVAAPGAAVPAGVAVPGAPVAAQPAAPPPAKPAASLEPTELAMSSVVAFETDEFKSVSESLRVSLLKLGLTRQEIDLVLDRAGAALAEPKEMIVLCRLPPEAIEERMPLVAYPAPRKTVRTGLIIVRNIDPKIKDEVQKLIADLGAAEYKQREGAEKRLTELGRLAIPSLKTALKSGDLEIVFRAERILLAQNEKLEGT
jgi:hypothetical protein